MSIRTLNFFFLLEKKMAYKNCFKDNEELFAKTVTEFEGRCSFVVFLLNVVLNITEIWERFCKCEKISDCCLVCEFRITYKKYQYDIYKNLLNMDF